METFFPLITEMKNEVFSTWRDQLSSIRNTVTISLVIGLAGVLAVVVLSRVMGVPPAWFTRDPADVTNSSAYIGLLSSLGIMQWVSAAAICLWAAFLLGRDKRVRNSAAFLTVSGLFCALLAVDDTFMIHDRILPRLHIPEIAMFVGYFIFIIGYGYHFFRRILKTEYILLLLAVFFLAVSALMDQLIPFSDFEAFVEDCPKFIGIVFWLAYFARTALLIVRESYPLPFSDGV